jgi:archaea-specific RecJ-like exonuclease
LKTYCISHIKDVDGVASASMVRAATGADVTLTDYGELLGALRGVPEDAERVVICDMGTDSSETGEFASSLGRLAKRAQVTYIDHHFLPEAAKSKIRRSGVKLVHNVKECASILTYLTFKDALPEMAKMVALCGAVTDYMDSGPKASELMEQADRQYILLEATMLSHALSLNAKKAGYPLFLVEELSKMKHPHEIEGVPGSALEQLMVETRLAEEVKRRGTRMGRLAYMVTTQYSSGNVARLLIGAFGVPVAVAMKEQEGGWYEVSLRGTSQCKVHLGKTIGAIASKLGGGGGGHRLAAGCRIPVGEMQQMLQALAKKV